jgi:hypothetical protein
MDDIPGIIFHQLTKYIKAAPNIIETGDNSLMYFGFNISAHHKA